MTAVARIGGAAPDSTQFLNITGLTTNLVLSGPGELTRIVLNAPVATSVITLYDSLTATGTKIGTITVPASPQPSVLEYRVAFTNGLTVVMGTASSDITVCVRP